ncbi:MAG TPA: beta-ketoacyl synthase N-terminal-like domain-containing protein, partial [Blastocatellia bacterium]
CFSVDVVIPEPGPALEELERELAAEMFAQSQDPVVAFREGKRYAQDFEAVRMPEQDQIKSRLRENGVYLITGGLGRVGFSLAKYLARAVKAKLVLTGRTELPSPEHWDEWLAGHQEGDKISEKIIKVRELEAEGAQVLALCADASSFEQMQRALACAQGRFGSINGVIHASGVVDAGAFRLIKDARLAEYEINVSAKVHGLFILEKALQESRLDFCLLASSLSSILGGLAHVEYSAANLFMDAFARKHNQTSPTAWTSVNWDRWEQENDRRSAISNPSNHLLKAGITPGEGAEVFRCLLSFDRASQIIVSPANLHDRINRWIKSGLSNGEADARDRAFMPAGDKLERAIAAIWQRTLGAEVGFNDNFFDLGGDSLTGIQIISEIKRELGAHVNPATLYEAPTVSALARYIRPGTPIARTPGARQSATRRSSEQKELAIVGMAGRFPGAKNVDQFWNNLLSGVESITFFTDEELLSSGVDPAVLKAPNYVKAKPVLEDVDLFDCAFFGYNPREAEVLDPQIRLFLECAWEALENAGYDSEKYAGSIGVFAGASLSTYLLNLLANPGLVNQVGSFQTLIGNEKDSLPTIASYKLGLTGPSVAVQTFCSTSLVALHVAAQSLLAGECDMALAGGVSVNLPQREGYFSESGGLTSPDGHCRAFDEEAQGMILGSGAAVVVVKRLDDALASGDCIYAVIKGSAINNDGSLRAGYSAPGVVGQADVVSKALASAGVEADTISYIETHGSGTQLGDAVEVAALTKAFQGSAQSKRSCAIGSVKTNVGHLDRAAGVTGLIKACLSLKHKVLPPSLNFQKPSSRIDFDGSPFYVNASLSQWKANGSPRRAGVTSLGVGGTNAHVILEEPPDIEASKDKRPWQLLMVSARTTSALEVATKNLTEYLRQNADVNLADVAFTYQVGRRDFKYRRIALCRDVADAIKVFENCDPKRVFTTVEQDGDRSVAFMFSGLGDHYVNMARGLYQSEAIFREQVDRCSQLLMPHLGVDLREVIYPEKGSEKSGASDQPEKLNLRRMLRRDEAAPDENARNLNQTRILQPALFVIEYSLAKLWIEWGIKPQAMIGYSLGEYVAACLAGVMSLEDALCLVARRAQMIQELPGGAMLAVSLPEGEIAQALGNDLSLSAINGLSLCVISGPVDAIADAERELGQKGIACSRLQTSHAFHSKMMRPIAGRFAELVASVKLSPPQVPYLSNVTGEWITPEQATDPNYWVRHLCEAVRFADGIDRLKEAATTLLEIGPGQTLSSLTAQYFTSKGVAGPLALASLRSEYDEQPDAACLLRTLGKLWLAGAKIDWAGFYNNERRRRLPLPTYPFERQRYWIEPQDRSLAAFTAQQRRDRKPDIADWFYAPAWRQSVLSDSTAQINSGDQEAC